MNKQTLLREWATEAEIQPHIIYTADLNQFAITDDGCTWNHCGFNAWFCTSGTPTF